MTKMLNVVTVMATLARDAELSYVGQGTAKLAFTLAGERVAVRDGREVPSPFYLPAVQLGKGAEVLAGRVAAGTAVLAVCALEYDSWQTKEGEKRSKVGLKVLRTEVIEGALETSTDSAGGVRLKGGFAEALFTGNLTRDAELRYTPGGDAVVGLSVAVNESYTGRDGQEFTKVHFIEVSAWRELAESLAGPKKGQAVLVKGSPKNESWEKDGVKRSTVKVEASVVQVLARPAKAEGEVKEREPVAAAARGAAKPAGRSGGLDIDAGAEDFPPVEEDLPF